MSVVRKSTMVELVQELEKLPQTPQILEMIAEAKAGEYHDYKNQKYVCGKVESSNRLMALGHKDLAMRIRDGEFDEEADASDVQMLRETAPPELHKVLKLDQPHEFDHLEKPEFKHSEPAKMKHPNHDKIEQMIHRNRMQANQMLDRLYRQTTTAQEFKDVLVELEILGTHLVALAFTNYCRQGLELKSLMDNHAKKLTGELNFIADHAVELNRG